MRSPRKRRQGKGKVGGLWRRVRGVEGGGEDRNEGEAGVGSSRGEVAGREQGGEETEGKDG